MPPRASHSREGGKEAVEEHLARLRRCRLCPRMIGPVVLPGGPGIALGRIYLVGQAPGSREGAAGRPFAWTAGKTLFRWFEGIGVCEATFRGRAAMAAVCRCFPGKAPGGGDRVPAREEIEACAQWMRAELALLRPRLILPVGRLAIERFLGPLPLEDSVGRLHRVRVLGREVDLIPLPHPSGASTWTKREPGLSRLAAALRLLARHPAWIRLIPRRRK